MMIFYTTSPILLLNLWEMMVLYLERARKKAFIVLSKFDWCFVKISEGEIIFLYTMKLVPPKDLRCIVHHGIICRKYYSKHHYLVKVQALFIPAIVHWQACVCIENFFSHSTSTLKHTLIFLKCIINEHVIHGFSIN